MLCTTAKFAVDWQLWVKLGLSVQSAECPLASIASSGRLFHTRTVAAPRLSSLQMVYVLKGSIKTELEGQGTITMSEGSCWIEPPRVKHKVLDYSDDCQVLEIVLPANFKTVELE